MDYFIKASALIILFYSCYKLFLQRETFFQSNRWFLLTGLLVSIIFPLIIIPVYIEYTPISTTLLETTTTSIQPINSAVVGNNIVFTDILFYLYLIGLIWFSGKLIMQLTSLFSLLKSHSKIKKGQFYFIETDKNSTPFSFFNHIVYNPELFTKQELDLIIIHEKTHAKQLHSLDVIIAQIATVVFWFNPFIWWYLKEIQQNLEFIADSETQKQVACSKRYQTVLLKASVGDNQLSISNQFYQSLIKKRIIMLQKSKSKNYRLLKYTIVLPFLALFLMSFNVKEVYVAIAEPSESQLITETFTISSKTSDKEIESIKNKLEAQADGLKIKFSNLKRDNNGEIINLSIETKLKGKNRFLHNVSYESKSNKAINNILLKIENGQLVIEDEKQDMIMRVTEKGVVANKLPVKEKTTSTETIHAQNSGDNIKLVVNSNDKNNSSYKVNIVTEDSGAEKSKFQVESTKNKPLYVIDNIIVEENEANIDAEKIASVNVLKGDNATNKYGVKGKNGAVEITIKKNYSVLISDDNKPINITNDSIYILEGDIKNADTIIAKRIAYKLSKANTTTSKKNNPWKIDYEVKEIEHTPTSSDAKKKMPSVNAFRNKKEILTSRGLVDKDKALIIIDGKKTEQKSMDALDPESILSFYVFKAEKATRIYGDEAKNGAIIIATNKGNPWKVEFNENINDFTAAYDKVYLIDKNTSDKALEDYKGALNQDGIYVDYTILKRNKSGEIISIKISLKDDNGSKSSSTWENNKETIPKIWIGKSNGSLIASSSYK